MSWVLVAITGWLTAATLVGLVTWGLVRSAALADRRAVEASELAQAVTGEASETDRRVGAKDRRSASRPWGAAAPGRRADDRRRDELSDAERALQHAEMWRGETDARESA